MHFTLDKNLFSFTLPKAKEKLVLTLHLRDNFFADFANQNTFVPAVEIVKQKQFAVFLPNLANNIACQNVRKKICGQALWIHNFFFGFSKVFHNVRNGLAKGVWAYGCKIVSAKAVKKIFALTGRLHFMVFGAEIFDLNKLQIVIGDINQCVKM